jgi:hypothetical protein
MNISLLITIITLSFSAFGINFKNAPGSINIVVEEKEEKLIIYSRDSQVIKADFSTQPNVQGSFVNYNKYFNKSKLKNSIEFLNNEINNNILITFNYPNPIKIIENSPILQKRFSLWQGLATSEDYLRILSEGRLAFSRPDKEISKMQYHMLIHDMLNHFGLQTTLAQEVIDATSDSMREYFNFKKYILSKHKTFEDNLFAELEGKITSNFDITHGSLNNTLYISNDKINKEVLVNLLNRYLLNRCKSLDNLKNTKCINNTEDSKITMEMIGDDDLLLEVNSFTSMKNMICSAIIIFEEKDSKFSEFLLEELANYKSDINQTRKIHIKSLPYIKLNNTWYDPSEQLKNFQLL